MTSVLEILQANVEHQKKSLAQMETDLKELPAYIARSKAAIMELEQAVLMFDMSTITNRSN